ncbi:MAG TPA: sigma-70 family RNA polymerase sigma factor [Firmicutes bacterium]|nr:sigma-70 family RNA polymerase sigma factor [Bacillota bacterium]
MDKTRELIRLSQQGDLQARARLVHENMPLVKSIAGRFLQRGLEYEDLLQIGSIGLLKAIRDFDFSYDVRFSTYAVPKIIGEIKQQLRRTSPLRIARSLRRLASEAIAAKDDLSQQLGRTATVNEIAAYLRVPAEEIVAAFDAVQPVTSLQAAILPAREDSPELEDFISTTPDQEHFMLKQALDNLDPLEKKIILLRYFAEKSQTEVAEELGTSQAQISRLEARIVRQLRHEL